MAGDWEVPAEIRELESDYHLIGELGRGGMAVVYLARDRALGRSVAIKVIRAKYVEDAEAMARFAREARTAAQLQHPNIVTLFAVRRLESQGLALVMQYVPGLTLKALIQRQGPLPVARVEQVLRDVGAALAYAHRHGVIHRDVKPENIFIDEITGRALLSDFGAALSAEHDTGLTLVGTAIGTPAYMSPEQIDGGEIDDRSDLYSLSLVAWEMLTATRPWSGSSLYSIIYRQKHEELQPADSVRGDIPPALLYAIEGGLHKDRAERWGSVDEFVARMSATGAEVKRWKRKRRTARVAAVPGDLPAELEGPTEETPTVAYRRPANVDAAAVAAAAAIPVPAPLDAPAPAPAPRRRRRGPLVVAALLLAILGAGAYALYPMLAIDAPAPTQVATRDAPVVTTIPVTPDTAAQGPPVDSMADSIARSASASSAAPSTRAADSARAMTAAAPAGPAADSVRTDSQVARATAPPASAPSAERPPEPPPAAGVGSAPAEQLGSAPPPLVAAPAVPVAPVPTSGPPLVATSNTVLAGGSHSCLLTTAGELSCWGSNNRGQLGTGEGERRVAPARVGADLRARDVALGGSHSCALRRDGGISCWGANDRGQLGDGSSADHATPTPVAGERTYRAVAAGRTFTCAVSGGGEAYCWGANGAGQLGDGSRTDRGQPVRVGGGHRFTTVAAGWQHACALEGDGRAYCWGENEHGQLGVGGPGGRTSPAAVAGDLRFTRIAAGSAHTCGVTRTGQVYCWGRNNYGQLGTGSTANELAPALVQSGERFASVAAGTVHSCALTFEGSARCWGRNSYGQLGDGTQTDRAAPVAVAGGGVFTRLNASGAHTCGVTTAGASLCWGYNVEGQLGDGTLSHRSRPRAVSRSN